MNIGNEYERSIIEELELDVWSHGSSLGIGENGLFILFYFILFYFILFYFILFYFILFLFWFFSMVLMR